MKRFMRLPSPAMVIACAALFTSLGGVSYAVATGSIDSREIKNKTIKSEDVRGKAIGGEKIRPDGIGGGAVKESALGTVPVASSLGNTAVVGGNGALVRGKNVTGSVRTAEGRYAVSFGGDVRGCVYTASVGNAGDGAPGGGIATVSSLNTNANSVLVRTANPVNNNPADRGFHLIVSC